MSLESALDAEGQASSRVIKSAYLNATMQSGMDNAIDDAIVARGKADDIDITLFAKFDEVPYDFIRKRISIVAQDTTSKRAKLIVKGAADNVLSVCNRILEGTEAVRMTTTHLDRIAIHLREWSAKGYRVLAVAEKEVTPNRAYTRSDEEELSLLGFLLFMDLPKEGIRDVLASFRSRDIKLKVITGDNCLVAAHVAQAIGLDKSRLLTGGELNTIGDEALSKLVTEVDLYAEVDPNQKERIIRALRKAGHVVGYLGDGINDAPALQAADIGISVDQAADVAKDSADLVLLEHDLGVLQQGIDQGRVTFTNTLKYISITTSANFGNMLSMAAMSLFLPFLPLLAKQILLNNFLSDIPALAIADDAVDHELIKAPRRWSIGAIQRFMLIFGLISSIFDFLFVALLVFVFSAPPELFRTAWFVESLLTELVIMLVLRTHRPFYASRPGRALLLSTLAVMAVAVAIPYMPYREIFGFVAIPMPVLLSLMAVTSAYVASSEFAKRIFFTRAD